MKILIVDDEPDIVNLLKHFLTGKGRTVISASNGEEGLARLQADAPDLVILDVMMPGLTGWDVLQRVRATRDVPVIMLTAKDTPMDTSRGLLAGADDYMSKPFDLGELEARITAVMRRAQPDPAAPPTVVEVGEVHIDDATKRVTVRGKSIKLSPKEYELLRLLASEPGKVFSHDEIIEKIWENKPFVSAKDVIKYVNLLRQKVERRPKQPALIVNVRGFGYKCTPAE